MRLIVAGSRWIPTGVALLIVDAAIRVHRLEPREVLIAVDGIAPVGPAEAAMIWARSRGLVMRPFHAHWFELGDAAGDERRSRLVDSGTHMIAIWDGLSTGTQDLLARARRRRLPVVQLEVVPSPSTAIRLEAERKAKHKRPIPAIRAALARAA